MQKRGFKHIRESLPNTRKDTIRLLVAGTPANGRRDGRGLGTAQGWGSGAEERRWGGEREWNTQCPTAEAREKREREEEIGVEQ
jgi:hypothetical protein